MSAGAKKADYLVIGSGIAGLTFALEAASSGSVIVVTKKEIAESNTNYAQGGIASVLSAVDSFESHIEDTLRAGGGLNDRAAVELLARSGPAAVEWLCSAGAEFNRAADGARFELGREGGHSHRRIAHARDKTGFEIERALVEAVRARRAIEVYENHIAVNLISTDSIGADEPVNRALGCYVLDKENSRLETILARVTVIATGGAGKVFLYTSNPDIASGDGIALAYRIGALIENMEFVQFHPTCLYHPLAKSFLISEAVRGEGAELTLLDGTSFMKGYHELGSLAPRDVVALAIDREMKRAGSEYLYLDTTRIKGDFFKDRFPTIYQTCLSFGYDPTKEPLPIAPAAHYLCGGIKIDLAARSSIGSLYAIGECACSGAHGANRLASNSLLEAVVFARLAARSAKESLERDSRRLESLSSKIKPWDPGAAVDDDEMVALAHMWDETRRLMWNYVGVARSDKRLARAKNRLKNLKREVDDYYWRVTIGSDLVELRALIDCAALITESAIRRKESRGLHFNIDYPERSDADSARSTLLTKKIMSAAGWP